MKRILRNFAIGLSGVMLVVIVALRVRSYFALDFIQWTDTRHFPALVSCGGRVIISYQHWPNGAGGNEPGWKMG